MAAKSKSAQKKKNISKHVLKAREDKTAASTDAKANENTDVVKRKQKKNRHIKDPSEAATYLDEWKASKSGKSGWKFNKNTQSWLIRHMYDADKAPKAVFSLLLEYLSGLEGKATRSWIRSEASRRALRYKNYEKETQKSTEEKGGTSKEDSKKDKAATEKNQSEEEREEEARWNGLSDHDKRKEYKRARKVIETILETINE
jgi:hypothetical protein